MHDLDLTHVHISRKTGAGILLVLMAIGLAILGYMVVESFLGSLMMGAILAVLFYPFHKHVLERVKRPGWAASITTTIVLLLILVPVGLLAAKIGVELQDLFASFKGGSGDQAQKLWESIEGPVERTVARFAPMIGVQPEDVGRMIQEKMGALGGAIFNKGLVAVAFFTGSVVFAFFSAISFFFALRDGHRLVAQILLWSPLGRRHTWMILETIQQSIFTTFYGVIVVAAAQGSLLMLGAWFTGLPSPLLWGVATGIASVLPLLGSSLVWIPASIVLFLQGAVGKGLFLIVWGLVVVGMVDNVLRPIVVTSSLPVNGFVVLIAMLGGVEAFGVSGILIGPMTVALILALAKIVGERMHDAPVRSEQGSGQT